MSVFFRNVIKLASGSVIGQIVVLAAMPLMARLYTPEQFGVAQAALSVLTVLLIVGALRLETALLTVADADEWIDLFKCAWWLSLMTAGLALLLALGTVLLHAEWPLEQCATVVLLPVLGLLASWNQLMSYTSLREQAFGPNARAKIIQPSCYATGALGFGVVKGSPVSLLMADMVGRFVAAMYLVRTLRFKATQFKPPSWTLLKNTIYRHRELATIGLISSLINAGGSAFTAAMLLSLFGAFEAGQYAMIERMVGMPVGLLVATISQVFMASISKFIANGNLPVAHTNFRRVLRAQLITGLPVALLLYFLSPLALQILLGQGWETAGAYAKALTLLYLSSYIVGPLNMTLTILGRQRIQLLWDSFRLAIVAATWGATWVLKLEPERALWFYSISACIAYATYLMLADWAFRNPPINESYRRDHYR